MNSDTAKHTKITEVLQYFMCKLGNHDNVALPISVNRVKSVNLLNYINIK